MNYLELAEQAKAQPHALVRMSTPPSLDIAREAVDKWSFVVADGRNPDANSAYETLAEDGLWALPTAADAVRVKAGGNAADDAAGTGIRTIEVRGLDENWLPATETLTTAGASASASTTTTFIRVFAAEAKTAGSGEVAAADIVLEHEGGGDLIKIPQNEGRALAAVYTVPASHSAYLLKLKYASADGDTVTSRLVTRAVADSDPARQHWFYRDASIGNIEFDFADEPLKIGAKTDIFIEVLGAAAGEIATGGFVLAVNDER